MRTALLTDIHGNLEALDACLRHVASVGVDEIIVMGDLVGYGPDPALVVDRIAGLAAKGARVLKGNHDDAIQRGPGGMNEVASEAILWSRDRLDGAQRQFLIDLPMTYRRDDILFVHASAARPESWAYVSSAEPALASLKATDARVTFCGHTHVPILFHRLADRALESFVPQPGKPVPLSRARRYVGVIGAVGQPRDRNPNACWGLLDGDEVTLFRVPYDVDATAAKIRAAGLSDWLAVRLYLGR